MKPTIEIIVQSTGELRIDALNFKGADCEQATQYLEEALGAVRQKTRKPEYHQRTRSQAQQRLGS